MTAPEVRAAYEALPPSEQNATGLVRLRGPAARRAAADARSWCIAQMLAGPQGPALRDRMGRPSWVKVHAELERLARRGERPPWAKWLKLRPVGDLDVGPRALMRAYHGWERRAAAPIHSGTAI